MSQAFTLPNDNESAHVGLTTRVPACLQALQTCFSGASAPSNPVAGQFWFDTSAGYLKQRNAANSAWLLVAITTQDSVPWVPAPQELGALSASRNVYVAHARVPLTIQAAVLLDTAGQTGTSGNEWTFQLRNKTQSLNLFSATVGTYTWLSGVGPGTANGTGTGLVADTPYKLTPNQNANVATDDVLEFQITKTGTATAFTRLSLLLYAIPR